METLRDPIAQLVETPSAGMALVLGILGAVWSASGYIGAFGRAMNRIYEVEEGRPVWKLRPLMLCSTVVSLCGGRRRVDARDERPGRPRHRWATIGFGDTALTVWNIARWPVVLALSRGVAILYYATPNVKQPKFRWISLGASSPS